MLITVIIVVAVLAAAAFFWLMTRKGQAPPPLVAAREPSFRVEYLEPEAPAVAVKASPEPAPVVAEIPSPPSPPQWPLRIDPKSTALDDEARLRMLTDLGVVRTAWCVPILAQAYAEETAPALRLAALRALADCRQPAAAETLEAAQQAADPGERAVAVRGLAELNAGTAGAP